MRYGRYGVDMERTKKLTIRFYQGPSYSVLFKEDVPEEMAAFRMAKNQARKEGFKEKVVSYSYKVEVLF